MILLRTLADTWLVRYSSCSSPESYSHALATSYIPFDSSRPPDSNETLADQIRQLAVELPQLLVSSPGEVATLADPGGCLVGPLFFFFLYQGL